MSERQRIILHRDFIRSEERKKLERLRMIEHLNAAQKTRYGSVLYPVSEKELL